MHILVLPSWYPNKNNLLSGIFFKEQAESLAKQNLKVGCIVINESSPKYIFSKNECTFDYYDKNINNVNTIGILYPIAYRLKWLRTVVRKKVFYILFKKYIKKYGQPDLIHLHSFLYGDLAIWVKEKYGIGYIVTEHSSGFVRDLYSEKKLSFAKKVFTNSKFNICVSKELKKMLEKKFDLKFRYIANSIDTEYFLPKKIQKINFNFINIAFLNKNKNQYMLIKAFSKAFHNKKNVTLTVVGSGPEYNNLNTLIQKLNMQERIKLYGIATRDEVLNLLQKSDAFVLSSQYETFGVVIIEAMSCGLPVVSTRSGGPESIIINKKLGVLANKDIDSLSNGMLELYNTTYDKNYIREYVVNNFSSNFTSQRLIEVYNK